MRVEALVIAALLACGKPSEPPANDDINEGEVYARKARAELTAVITGFHDDLVAGRLDAAHARLAPMTHARISIEALAGVAKQPALAAGVTYKMDGSTISNGLAKVSGVLAGPSGPASVGLFVDGAAVLP
jgi:hypothetical protein